MSLYPEDPRLFAEGDLRATLQQQLEKLASSIDEYDAKALVATPVDALCEYFVNKAMGNPVRLKEEEIWLDEPAESKMDVSHSPYYGRRFDGRPVLAPATRLTFHVPFEGDEVLLRCRPSRQILSPIRATIGRHELTLTFVTTEQNMEPVKAGFDQQMNWIRQMIGWSGEEVQAFNDRLPGEVKRRVESRRNRLQANQQLVAGLGFPVRRRGMTPQTYAVPSVRRKLRPRSTHTESVDTNARPEPSLDLAEYDHILNVCSNMVEVMERSPTAFRGMKEEHLRDHFLVQLNGQYDGGATGETFNYEGKTDVMVRYEGRVVFVAECKFWKGPQAFGETVDQLLGYTSWRDTKTAILIFNRNKDTTAVVEQIPALLQGHGNHVRDIERPGESEFRCVLRHRDDVDRQLVLTVLVFDVPT